MKKTYHLKELPEIAELILSQATNKTLLFYGEMGTGKTTLIKELTKQLGTMEPANSPTFSLVNEYATHQGETVYHFDFYRIESEAEAYDMGMEEYFHGDAWCLVEWPSCVENLLPLDSIQLHLTKNQDATRTLEIRTSPINSNQS